MRITSGGGTASTVATNIASTPAGTGLFSYHDTTFPSWNLPDPSAYAWTLPNTSHWYNFGANMSRGVFSFVANSLLELIAWIMHIAILVSSKFSDPSWITDPITKQIANVFHNGYEDVFVRFLPVLVMIFVGWLAWKYIVAHHAKMLSGIVSMLLSVGLIAFFFLDFGQAFSWVNGAGNLVTNTAASAVASTVGTTAGSEYDTLWNNYILYPWEYGQFGQISGTLSSFDVNSSLLGSTSYEYQPDPTSADPNPSEQPLPTTEVINGQTYKTNWVLLFLNTTNSQGRSDLENIITSNSNVFATGSPLSTNAVKAADPFAMIPFLVIELLLIITPVIFLLYVGFQLFVRELLFIVTLMMGIVTVPMSFIPEIGWSITLNWIREAVGHQVERLSNAVYAALLFAVAGIITTSVGSNEADMMLAFLVDAILFAAALIYRQKVFSLTAHPMADAVRGVDTHPRDLTVDEYIEQKRAEENGGRRTLRGATISKPGKLAEHFDHVAEHEEHRHLNLPSSRHTDDTLHVRADEPGHVSGSEHKVSGHLADSFKDGASTVKRQKFARNAHDLKQALGNAIQKHLDDMSNPGAPKLHEEKVREREQRARGIEAKLHKHSVKALRRTIMSGPKLSSGFGTPPDDDSPPPTPPGGGPVADSDDEKLRKMMVSADGQMSQGVVTDKDGKEIAYEPPSIARPQRDEAEISTPSLSEGFNLPMADPDTSSTSAPVQENEEPRQVTLATGFSSEPQLEPETAPNQAQLSGEKALPQMGENGADGLSASENVPESNSGADRPVSTGPIPPVQPRPLPSNVTRLQDEREHRQEVEGRQREQRTQRLRRQQGRRRVVRVNERSPRPPRPRGPEL